MMTKQSKTTKPAPKTAAKTAPKKRATTKASTPRKASAKKPAANLTVDAMLVTKREFTRAIAASVKANRDPTESMRVGTGSAPKSKTAKAPTSAKPAKATKPATRRKAPKWVAKAREVARERMKAYWDARAEATLAKARASSMAPVKPAKATKATRSRSTATA